MQCLAGTICAGYVGRAIETIELEFPLVRWISIVVSHPLDQFSIRFELSETVAKSSLLHRYVRCRTVYGGMGAFDLVMMCASFWTSAQRQENKREETMLRRYVAMLHAHGVTNYMWDQLWEDYRFMILIFLQAAIWDQTNGSERDYWWPKLHCLVSAARDHNCVSLLRYHLKVERPCHE